MCETRREWGNLFQWCMSSPLRVEASAGRAVESSVANIPRAVCGVKMQDFAGCGDWGGGERRTGVSAPHGHSCQTGSEVVLPARLSHLPSLRCGKWEPMALV
jgi:hypothetical protein